MQGIEKIIELAELNAARKRLHFSKYKIESWAGEDGGLLTVTSPNGQKTFKSLSSYGLEMNRCCVGILTHKNGGYGSAKRTKWIGLEWRHESYPGEPYVMAFGAKLYRILNI